MGRKMRCPHKQRRTAPDEVPSGSFCSDGRSIEPVAPGQTYNIGSPGHLTQVQHKRSRVKVVDHFDKGSKPVYVHIVCTIDGPGTITENIF